MTHARPSKPVDVTTYKDFLIKYRHIRNAGRQCVATVACVQNGINEISGDCITSRGVISVCMPSKQSCKRSEDIVEDLAKKDPSRSRDDLKALSRNQLVHLGRNEGVLDDNQFEASIPSDTFVVKSYLWSYLDDDVQRSRVRDYVIICTKIQHRAYLTLKTAYFACTTGRLGPEFTVEAFVKAFLKTPSDAFQALVLPLHLTKLVEKHPLKPFVDATRREFFGDVSFLREGDDGVRPIDPLQDSLESLVTKTGLDNAKKYIATKVKTAVFNHVFVHLHRRVKGSLEARKCHEESSDVGGMRELYDKGETNKDVGPRDREMIVALREVFLTPQQAREVVDVPDASPTPKYAEVMLHLDCCRLAEETPGSFTPFPNASFSRCYQRLCTRLFCLLLKVPDMRATLNLTPSLARKRAKKLRGVKTAGKPEAKMKGCFSMRKNEKDALVSSIETDGVGMSIVLLVERPEKARSEFVDTKMTPKQKREYAEMKKKEEIDAVRPFMDDAIWRGLDPGRVNLYTTAERRASTTERGDVIYDKMFYSRNRHLRKCGRNRMGDWRDKRAQRTEVAAALDALATTGGAKTHMASRWFSYLEERTRYLDVMEEEFLMNDTRCKLKMTQFRLSQRALARAADRLVLEGNQGEDRDGRKVPRRPVIIGYGTGRGNGGGHKGEQGVPVKAMYRALLEAFKRHRILGGVLNVWEHLTTQMCHRCHERTKSRIVPLTPEDVKKEKRRLTSIWEVRRREAMEQGADIPPLELPSDEELFRRQKTDRDFRRPAPPDGGRDRLRRRVRICEHCSSSDQPWKLRNRDFNAAINILTLLETTLRGEERPTYLCTQRAAGPPKRRRRTVASVRDEEGVARSPRFHSG